MPAQLTNLKVRDVAIKLHRAGRGPTVLFLHGAGGVPQWLPFFEALAERYELLVPEHPGFGLQRIFGTGSGDFSRMVRCRLSG
jgi:pimeloyl-ACP methyl ester carboxylesterase